MSSAQDRLSEIYEAYQTAKANQKSDLKAATTDEQVDSILANIDRLHASYLEAIDADLKATGPDIEAAYAAAKDANAAIADARRAAQKLPDLIRKTSDVADTVATLLETLGA